jgi:hypothetical protein
MIARRYRAPFPLHPQHMICTNAIFLFIIFIETTLRRHPRLNSTPFVPLNRGALLLESVECVPSSGPLHTPSDAAAVARHNACCAYNCG